MGKIEINDNILEKIRDEIKNSEFKTIEEYIGFVLEELLKEDEEELVEGSSISKEQEENVKDRLRGLGYL